MLGERIRKMGSKEIPTALKSIQDAKSKAMEAAKTCKIEDVIKQVQIVGMSRNLMPRVSPKDIILIGKELTNMVSDIANALRKGCRM